MDMPIRDKSLQHTDQLAPFGSLQRLRALIEVIVSYNDNSAFGALKRSLSRIMITTPSGPYSFPYPLLRYMQT